MNFYNKSKLMLGDKALSNIPHELKMKNLSKPMVIGEKMDAYPPFHNAIKYAFDNDKIKIPAIMTYKENLAYADTINEYVEAFKECDADSIIVVGRDAVISVAKGVKLCLEQGVKDIKTIDCIRTPKFSIPLFVVPVFFGCGDEGTGRLCCYDDKNSYNYISDSLMPDAIIVDKSMTFTPSKTIMASSMMYALALSIISYTNKQSGIMNRTSAMASIELLCNTINNREFKRRPLSFAPDITTSLVISGITHYQLSYDELDVISSIVARHMRLPYSKVYSMLFPHYYEQIVDKNDISNMEVLLPIIGEERYVLTPIVKRAEQVVYEVRRLINFLSTHTGFKYNLSDFKMKRDDIEKLAKSISERGIDYDIALTTLERTF